MSLTAYKQDLKMYGLHPTIWRRLRAIIGGCCDLELYDKGGQRIGTGLLARYQSEVHIPSGLSFRSVSWQHTISECQPQPDGEAAFLGPSIIPIGVNRI